MDKEKVIDILEVLLKNDNVKSFTVSRQFLRGCLDLITNQENEIEKLKENKNEN